jgi:hypothetical protein
VKITLRFFVVALGWAMGFPVTLLAQTSLDFQLNAKIPAVPTGTYFFYELAKPVEETQALERFAKSANLSLAHHHAQSVANAQPVKVYVDHENIPRMVTVRESGSIQWFADLEAQNSEAPDAPEAQRQALAWIHASQLIPTDLSTLRAQGVTSLYRTVAHRLGAASPPVRVMQSLSYATEIGGVAVIGPSSTLTISVSAKGIVGASSSIRPVAVTGMPVQFKPAEVVRQELATAIRSLRRQNSTVAVDSARLIYYEQGARYVQPAYEFLVHISNENAAPETHRIVIAAAAQTPELIRSNVVMEPWPQGTPANMVPVKAANSDEPDPTILFGLYFNRLDYNEWALDPWWFWQNVRDGQSIGLNLFTVPSNYSMFLRQFQFNDVWMWQNGPNYENYSALFVDRVHFAAVNGHGNKFSIAGLQNWADLINLKSTRGFGAYNGNSGLTAYIEWRGCLIIPSPDPADGAPPVGPNLTPWFDLFKGIRGTYGFHSQMTIENMEGPQFGGWIGLRVPILSAWMQAVSNASGSACGNTPSGSAETDCAAAVIVTAHENDTLFDLEPIKDPPELTIYWQRPAAATTSVPFVP